MSHFTVMVIGKNPEDQLEPFSENLEVPAYKNKEGEDSTYNPLSKWDWYELGGRWQGSLKLKEGADGAISQPSLLDTNHQFKKGHCDQALKKDIDFETPKKLAAEEAAKSYDAMMEVIGDLPPHKLWEEFIKELPEGGDRQEALERVRVEYHAQPRVMATAKSKLLKGLFDSVDEFAIPREQYIREAYDSAGVPYAVLKDGKWYEKGEMGWFGMSSNEVPQSSWNEKVEELLRDTPDDELISIYDCHI